ncbi:cell division initiation protein [Streptomyces sp. GC420]|uniref:cell division initiation protein n=1 Tax=Streptomyces sp. GC420 TaxID=2697568 RepID=UPI0014151AA1|nr:cell division initiation protein [Streptomyces sp. GC420]NBM15212.1 cell division initiation protein [Streptomyces sp. GC420]
MDVQKKLDEIVDAVGSARSMPMSASCVVNRAELLAMLEEVRQALPGSLAQAQELLGGREQMVEQARQEAERIIESAHAQRGSLISDTEIARRSQEEADRILAEARREAEEIRAEADEYVDSKLANFEVVLTKTIGSVDRGREKLLGRGDGLDGSGYEDPDYADAPERSADPETLRRRADEYVDAKLGAFEAVLTKTLDAVGRGRQKLHGRIATDDLGAHLAAQDAAGVPQQHTSDADYLADLAELAGPQPDPRRQDRGQDHRPEIPAQQPYAPQDAYAYQHQQQDPYAGYQQQYAQPDPYAASYAQQQDYGRQGYDQQHDPYASGYPQQQGYDQQQYVPQRPEHAPQQQDQGGHQSPAAALDETSFFDTSMIDLDQLRQYEQGR